MNTHRTPEQPCKPRAHSTHTDKLPMVYRPGALDADNLPSRMGDTLIYRDGRKEKLDDHPRNA